MDVVDEPLTLNPELLGLQRVGEERRRSPPKYAINKRGTPARILKKNKLFYDINYVSGNDLYRSPKKALADEQTFGIVEEEDFKESDLKRISPKIKNAQDVSRKPKADNSVIKYNVRNTRSNSKLYEDVQSPCSKVPLEPKSASNKWNDTDEESNDYDDKIYADTDEDTTTCKVTSKKYLRIKLKPVNKSHPGDSPSRRNLIRRSQKSIKAPNAKTNFMLHKFEKKSNVHRKLDFDCQVNLSTIVEENGQRLKNLLKLPKAHKWVCFEWFYSHLDKVLFQNENDFQICLKQKFPNLKTRMLTRVEWCKIRKVMGKPRRCSEADELVENQPLTSFIHGITKHHTPQTQFVLSPMKTPNSIIDNDPLLGSSQIQSKLLNMDGTLGKYSVAFLVQMIRFTKLLRTKKQKIQELKQMNSEAEKLQSYDDMLSVEFRCRYATIILDLDKLNKNLRELVKQLEDGLGKELANTCDHAYELESLTESMEGIKAQLHTCNLSVFRDNVEVHMAHIQKGLWVQLMYPGPCKS